MKFNDVNIEQKVLERAAFMLFHKGIKGWNMDQLAEQVGLAKNTLYKMIGSKEELIEKVITNYIRDVQGEIVTIISIETDYIVALEKIITGFPGRLNSIYTDSMHEILNEYPTIERKICAHRDELTKRMIGFIETGINNGILRKDLQPEMVFELFRGILIYFIKSGCRGAELTDRIRVAFSCILDGIRNH